MKKNDQELATKKDLEATKQELLAELATKASKDDLKNFATKDDIKNFATKDDLRNFATKNDLKNFATKDDFSTLRADVETLAGQVADNTKELVNLRHEMATKTELDELKTDVRQILVIVDGMAKKFDNYQTEKAATEHTFSRHENRLDDHETRIKVLEEREPL